MRSKMVIINDGRDYYLAEEMSMGAKKMQESLKDGTLTGFTPVFRFTFFDKFREDSIYL